MSWDYPSEPEGGSSPYYEYPPGGYPFASAAGIYGLVLQIFSLMPVHRLSGGKATAVVLIPVAVGFLLAIGLYILLLVLFFSAINTFTPSQ